jgi:hypothetical protein
MNGPKVFKAVDSIVQDVQFRKFELDNFKGGVVIPNGLK